MEYRLRAYVDELFQSAPRTQRAYELKVELTQNLLDKYFALLSEGKSEDDAYNLTVMSMVRRLWPSPLCRRKAGPAMLLWLP